MEIPVRKMFVFLGKSSSSFRCLSPLSASEAGIMLSAIGSWLQALWDHDDPSGPSILFQPTELVATIQIWWDEQHSDLV